MGGSHSTKVDEALASIGIGKIESGITKAEAQELWAKFDKDGNGVLEAKEAAELFDQIGTLAIQTLQKQVDSLHAHLKDEAFVNGLLAHFDTNKDGKVTKAEFVRTIVKGYHPGAEVERVEKELEEKAAAEAAAAAAAAEAEAAAAEHEKPAADEEEQPDTKKAKVDA